MLSFYQYLSQKKTKSKGEDVTVRWGLGGRKGDGGS